MLPFIKRYNKLRTRTSGGVVVYPTHANVEQEGGDKYSNIQNSSSRPTSTIHNDGLDYGNVKVIQKGGISEFITISVVVSLDNHIIHGGRSEVGVGCWYKS